MAWCRTKGAHRARDLLKIKFEVSSFSQVRHAHPAFTDEEFTLRKKAMARFRKDNEDWMKKKIKSTIPTLDLGYMTTKSEGLAEYSEEPEYPPLFDCSKEGLTKYKRDRWIQRIREYPTVEEKMFWMNERRYYGFNTYVMQPDHEPYGALDFLKASTRTKLIQGLPVDYEDLNAVADSLLPRVKENIISKLSSLLRAQHLNDSSDVNSGDAIQTLVDALLEELSGDFAHLESASVDIRPRVEAQWFCGGFYPHRMRRKQLKGICDEEDYYMQKVSYPIQIVCDTAAQIRTQDPLPAFVDLSDAVVESSPDSSPKESGKYVFDDLYDINEALQQRAIKAGFAWTFAQATFQGFECYNDITYPLVSQGVLTDGQRFTFYAYQLNTTKLHDEFVDANPKWNLCWCSEDMKLYSDLDSDGNIVGVNDQVIRLLIKFLVKTPSRRQGVNMTPYLGPEKFVQNLPDGPYKDYIAEQFKFMASNRPRMMPRPEIYMWEKIYKIDHPRRPRDARTRFFELKKNPNPSIEERLRDSFRIFIDNEFVDAVSGKTFQVLNPSTEEVLCDVAEGDVADVDKAVQAAQRAFALGSTWRTIDASERGVVMNRLCALIEKNTDYIAKLEALNNGKALKYAADDVGYSLSVLRYYAGYADKIHGKNVPIDGDFFSVTKPHPVGVVGQIIPWNYPLLMLAWKWGPALAAGCTVVLKPDERTPLTALFVAQLAKEAGFPPGVINVVPGFGSVVGAAIASHMGINKVAFTGSVPVGKLVMEAAAKSNLKRVLLELGGKSPLCVFADTDVDEAVKICHNAIFMNHGQNCCAGSRTLVQDKIYDEFVRKATAMAKERKVGDPFAADTEQGPLIDANQVKRVLGFIEAGKKEGARLLTGGGRLPVKGFFVEPTVFADVQDSMSIGKEEIFGPVQIIQKFSTMEELIPRVNSSTFGLAAGVITDDVTKAMTFANSVEAGSVWVNCYDIVAAQAPFGGFKMSGQGRELSMAVIKKFEVPYFRTPISFSFGYYDGECFCYLMLCSHNRRRDRDSNANLEEMASMHHDQDIRTIPALECI
ncbi:unnamed protein product [Notodromas monacha]|uniref:Aldehyde dehydrogenase domain-containing protein n=1 Tax=Notodromas monacha TaxID=399045 RepID=A0A7R9BCW5_9CRUS|nr:unnamed protein product [Notodromas monacha]CAG0913020.1 unnamed protein product [Notodromas monacha]